MQAAPEISAELSARIETACRDGLEDYKARCSDDMKVKMKE